MEKVAVIYTTFAQQSDAIDALRILMSENLATCGNIMAPHLAIYPWEGKVAQETEVAALFKTSATKADALVQRLRTIHPYKIPCILKLEATALPDYANWLTTPIT